MMSNLGGFIEQKISVIPEDCDLPNLLNLFLLIAQSQSFIVSIPILVTWTRLLRSDIIGASPATNALIAPLLDLCSSRLIRYESMPEDSEDPSLIFLFEDIDTVPERHAFLGNYRRYSVQIIELIVRQKKSEAIYYILGQVDQSLEHLYDSNPPFSSKFLPKAAWRKLIFQVPTYSKTSIPVLRVDASFSVVEAALKGFTKWRASSGSNPQQDVRSAQSYRFHKS
jgi:exportin-5